MSNEGYLPEFKDEAVAGKTLNYIKLCQRR